MTKNQELRVKQIRQYVEENDMFKGNPDYEFKEFSVEEMDNGIVDVYSVTGRKNDEGTMAEALCRNYRHIFIGKLGGMTTYVRGKGTKKSTTLHGWPQVMIYGYHH